MLNLWTNRSDKSCLTALKHVGGVPQGDKRMEKPKATKQEPLRAAGVGVGPYSRPAFTLAQMLLAMMIDVSRFLKCG
jgi:hypothetical protein